MTVRVSLATFYLNLGANDRRYSRSLISEVCKLKYSTGMYEYVALLALLAKGVEIDIQIKHPPLCIIFHKYLPELTEFSTRA